MAKEIQKITRTITIDEPIYEKSDDPNVIYRFRLIREEILKDRLQEKIDKLQEKIDGGAGIVPIPEPPYHFDNTMELEDEMKHLKDLKDIIEKMN